MEAVVAMLVFIVLAAGALVVTSGSHATAPPEERERTGVGSLAIGITLIGLGVVGALLWALGGTLRNFGA